MNSSVLFFSQINRTSLPLVGGKGANLGELSKAGFPVPSGFCVTTQAYRGFVASNPEMGSLLQELNRLDSNDFTQLRLLGERIRTHLLQLHIPTKLKNEIIAAWKATGSQYAYAVRSSATAEDLPTASFAGQQDTYLNVKGEESLLSHIQQCWASLFTDRAISYRAKNHFDHRQVYVSVIVQRMVHPELSGIMFTADPLTGHRKVITIDASFGMGEALVSGIVSADLYKVKEGKVIEKNISEKRLAVFPLPEGGTAKKEVPLKQRTMQALTNQQILQLAELGKKVEQHFGTAQDIEFCIENGDIFIVQSRPITSLYPLPDMPSDPLRIMISVGHIQVMTDALKPLGLSVFQTIMPKSILKTAGGRMFFDLTDFLHLKAGQKIIIQILRNMDESISRALADVVQRPEFKKSRYKKQSIILVAKAFLPVAKQVLKNLFIYDPSLAKERTEEVMREFSSKVQKDLESLNGTKRLETIQRYLGQVPQEILKIFANPVTFLAAALLLKKQLTHIMGSDYEIHVLTKSLPGNIMSEMGLQLGGLADFVRKHPDVESYLQTAKDETFYEGLENLAGGTEFAKIFQSFIETYGMRCPGEIDITKPRWREQPTLIAASILGDVKNLTDGEYRHNFAKGQKEVEEAKARIFAKTEYRRYQYRKTKRLIDVYRYMGGLREHHKHLLTIILDLCKQAIIKEAQALVDAGVLQEVEDVYYLTLEELIQVANGTFQAHVPHLVSERKSQFKWFQTLKQPRVLTSEGEIITGSPKKGEYPDGALIGSPISPGVVEGIARVVLSPETAHLNEGEILVAPHTDPGWTPLFQSAGALVAEVGGLMTHGSIVAREYGIPAVAGVDEATRLIQDGQRIRVDGTRGYVEILTDNSP